MMHLLLALILLPLFLEAHKQSQPPHIIFIYADDFGWNDVSFHGFSEVPTPNIDALALSGITLNNYYGEWLCTPSRGALLSGKYPIRLGFQHYVILPGEASGLPLDVKTLPEYLKKLGYATHMVGKWHLGYQSKAYMPTNRGFDTFFGYMNGHIDYYDYTSLDETLLANKPFYYGVDLYNGTKLVNDFRGKYATYVFTNQSKDIILNHDASKPLFLYLSHLAVHVGNAGNLLQAPPEIISKFKYIKDLNARIHAAKVSVLDDTIGTIFAALHQKDMLRNSLVVLSSDNGATANRPSGEWSSNYPLRGSKFSGWEGGVHLPAVLWSPLLQLEEPKVSNHLMHVSDWLPTFYSAAGGNISDLGLIDGHSMWESLTSDSPSPRKDLLNTMDPIEGVSAFRSGDLKLVNGTTQMGYNGWHGSPGFESSTRPLSIYKWVYQSGSVVRDILVENGWWIAESPDEWYNDVRVDCVKPPPPSALGCDPMVKPCLFNVSADPCEYHDLADQYPEIVKDMMNIILAYEKASVPPQFKPSDPRADPVCHNFAHVPWLDDETLLDACDYADHVVAPTACDTSQ